MPAEMIDGKVVSEKVRNEVAAAVANLPGKPCLAVVLVGDDPASALYVKSKGEKTEAAGMRSITRRFRASASLAEIEAELAAEFTRRRGRMAYEPIIGSGRNACVLHYLDNDAECRDGKPGCESIESSRHSAPSTTPTTTPAPR